MYFAALFVVFTIGIALFEHSGELSFKREALEEKLDTYSDIIQSTLQKEPGYFADIAHHLPAVVSADLRITIIDHQGGVLYDNSIPDSRAMENHLDRKEIKQAAASGKGSDVRESVSNRHPYLYYVKDYGLFLTFTSKRFSEPDKILVPDNFMTRFFIEWPVDIC